MKKFITFLAILMAAMLSFAQIPQTMSYQAVVRDGDNALVVSKPVSIELSILRGSDEGDVVYAEKHDAATNANGLVSLELGNGEQISETAFSQIDWSAGPYFVKTVAEIDGKTVTGVTPMLTVPYAKFAEKAGNIPDLTDYAKKSDIPEGANLDGYVKTEELNDYAKSADVDNTYVKKAEMPATLEDYAKTADVEQTYAKKDELPTEVDLSDYAKKSDLDGFATTAKMNDTLNVYAKSTEVSGNYVTKEEFENYVLSGGQADAVDLSVYAKSSDVNAALAELEGKIPAEQDLSGFATTAKLNDTLSVYAKSETVPTKVSDLENDANYITLSDVPAQDLTGYATKEELNALNIPSVEGLASETYVNEKVAAIQIPSVPTKVSDFDNDANYITLSDVPATDLTDYAKSADVSATYVTKEELSALNIPSVEGLASEAYVNEKVAAIEIPSVPTKVSDLENDANYITLSDVPATDLTDYAKSADVSATYVTKDEFETYVLSGGQADAVDLSVYAKSSDVTAALAELEGKIPAAQDLSAYATKEELNALNIPSVEGLASETYVNEQVAAIEIPTVPTKVSDLANDANYITLNDVPAVDLSGYATTAKMQDTLKAYPTTDKMNDTLDA
ncbi:MAG: hypothetical protein II663_01935, partial [Bacteroidales bacterium]|nr:hypothetical protein [Bacteroidales bacterium]